MINLKLIDVYLVYDDEGTIFTITKSWIREDGMEGNSYTDIKDNEYEPYDSYIGFFDFKEENFFERLGLQDRVQIEMAKIVKSLLKIS